MTNPLTAEQIDHLIGHTDHRPLTPAEHEALRAAVARLQDRREAGTLGAHGHAIGQTMGGFLAQLRQQLHERDKELKSAQDELGRRRRQVARLTTENASLQAVIAAVREVHKPIDHGGWTACGGCSRRGQIIVPSPCRTTKALGDDE